MPLFPFLLGFVSALLVLSLGIIALYGLLRRSRRQKGDIKGYLDLIPDLSEEQRARVCQIRQAFLPRVEAIRGALRAGRAELAELLFAEPIDRARIEAIAEAIRQRQAELEHEVIEHILEERELLSPPQKRAFYRIIVEQFAGGGLGVHDVRKGR